MKIGAPVVEMSCLAAWEGICVAGSALTQSSTLGCSRSNCAHNGNLGKDIIGLLPVPLVGFAKFLYVCYNRKHVVVNGFTFAKPWVRSKLYFEFKLETKFEWLGINSLRYISSQLVRTIRC